MSGISLFLRVYKGGKMKILAISCSPRKNGNTVAMLEEVLHGARGKNAETELFSVSGKNLQPCDGCWTCTSSGECHINDDIKDHHDRMVEADGIVFGTPVYFYGMTAQAKTILDRSMPLGHPDRNLTSKVAGVVVNCGSLGLVDVLKDLSYYIIQRKMIPANQVSAYIASPDDLKNMEQCTKALHTLGEQMVALAETGFKYPSEYMVRGIAYGTHTK
jgi:multimeric flavodoxin WrbA